MNSSITVSGNIIGELSEKIPSNIVALNELIKNSYDAGAKKIDIKLNTKESKLIISDDGSGMDKNDIDTLFHISNSKKEYGKINEYGRFTQGSKGLGFLSVFKFGDYVTWRTKKNKGLKFSVDYNNIINNDDISNYNIDIIEEDEITKGTEIEIRLDKYNLMSLDKYFKDEKNYEKIINAFTDESIIISIIIDNSVFSSTKKIDIKSYAPERQLYNIKYNSNEQQIKYYYNNILILNYPYKFTSNQYQLELELQVFQFERGKKKDDKKINKLFYNMQNDLTPLIYVNSNLFNNYTIFNPNVMKNIKSGLSLNQMIGFVKINSSDKKMNFNSDRTQFLQNELTDEIISFLNNINKFIQTEGSKYKKHLVDLDFLKRTIIKSSELEVNKELIARSLIKDTFIFKDKVNIQITDKSILYSIFGKTIEVVITQGVKDKNDDKPLNQPKSNDSANNGSENKEQGSNIGEKKEKEKNIMPAEVILKQKKVRIPVPSKQIYLYDYISKAIDSEGKKIELSDIDIKVDSKLNRNAVLQSVITECVKEIEYSYLDANTGVAIARLVVEFYQPKSTIDMENDSELLFYIPAKKSYTIVFNNSVSNIIKQINNLELANYREVIACCLRSIFEISIDSLRKCGKFDNIFDGIKKLEERVGKVIEYIIGERKFISEISFATLIDFDSLKNLLIVRDFKEAIEKSNLGAHKATVYMSDVDIKHLARIGSLFVVIINEMISNEKIN